VKVDGVPAQRKGQLGKGKGREGKDALLRVVDGVSIAALVAGSLVLAEVLLDGLWGVLEIVNLEGGKVRKEEERTGEEEDEPSP
jgi:hypothetical protein